MNQTKIPVYFIDEKDIRDLVKQYNPTRKIGDINIPELEKKINEIPFVDSANVYMNLNGNLNVDIKQRVPVFRLNKNGRDFYVDEKGIEFPISKNYSLPCMLVTGNIEKSEYQKLGELIEKIDKDDFSKKYFIGISKDKDNYNLLTSEGNYKVEIGDLDNIDFKVKGFKTFVEKYLVYQDPNKYKKISVKYDNQIVATLNPYFKENDSILRNAPKIEIKKPEEPTQLLASVPKKNEITEKKIEPKKEIKEEPKKEIKAEANKNQEKREKSQEKAKPKIAEKPKITETKSQKTKTIKSQKPKIIVE